MRTTLPLLLVVILGCGRPELAPDPTTPEPPQHSQPSQPTPTQAPAQFRLTSSYESRQGFRFSDQTVLTTSALDQGDGAADLQASKARSFYLHVPQGSLCLTTTTPRSLAEVLETDCDDSWSTTAYLWVRYQEPEPRVNRGMIFRTADDHAYRLRILELSYDAATDSESVLLEYEPYPAPEVCAGEGGHCLVSADCCNGRHTCTWGVCQY